MAEAVGKNTVMNIMSPEKLRWMDEQVRYSTAGSAWDHFIWQQGLVLAVMGGTPRSNHV